MREGRHFFDLLPRRSKGLSFANSEILRQPQAIELARGFEELEEQSHDWLRRMIRRSSLHHVHRRLKKPVQLQPFAKSLDEPHSTNEGKAVLLDGKTDKSTSFWPVTQSTLLGAFVARSFWNPNYPFLPYEN